MKPDSYHPSYPALDERLLLSVGPNEENRPDPRNYETPEDWQAAFDEWYRSYPGNCPNFCGHF